MKRLLLLALAVTGCADRYDPNDDPTLNTASKVIPDVDDIGGIQCPNTNELMREVTRADGSKFCVDVFEASLDDGARGNAQQASDDISDALDGTTTARASVGLQSAPAFGVSFYQAKAACENAGKRLCTLAEWERACRGPTSLLYPYGDDVDDQACNGFFNYSEVDPLATGSLNTCGSPYGVFDLSGNLSEWTASGAERVPGSGVLNDRAVRGGSYNGNAVSLRCVGEEYRDAPGTAPVDRGFRCCL